MTVCRPPRVPVDHQNLLETAAFRPGSSHIFSLLPDILGDHRKRSAATRSYEVRPRPENAVVVSARQLRALLAKPSARHAFKAVKELRRSDGRRIGDEQVDVIVLT
jgi:hypothetical protein